MSQPATQFDAIYYGLNSEPGKLRVAQSGMAWKGSGSDITAVPSADIKWAQWLRVARNFQLRVGVKDRKKICFDGFVREDHDKLQTLLKNHFSVTLETKEVSFKGWNWGETDFQGQDLAFLVSNRVAFELPLAQVANSNIAGRTEVSLEFSNPSSRAPTKSSLDEMVEIRFHVPGAYTKPRASDAGSQKSDDEEETNEAEISAAQVFHDMIKDKADIGQVAGDLILSFEEVHVVVPRGRYDVDMFPDFLRLRGKTYDYKILYTSIGRLFLLPKDDQHVLFILGLNSPIRQGQTRYQYLVMQFNREEEMTAELNLPEEEVAKYDRLKKNYEDPTFEVVSGVFRALSKKKIISTGSFQNRNGQPAIKANLKTVQGDLFLLEKYIFFVSKSPTLIELSDVHQAVFSRVGASMGANAARTFDLKFVTKSGPEITFSSINKEEHESTETYLKEKKIKLKNELVPDVDVRLAAGNLDDDDDDDMQSIASDEDDAPKVKVRTGGADDEDSEEDEDFEASASDSGSPSDTDSDASGAHTASDASGDRDFMKKKAKGKGKTKAKKDNAAAKDSDAEDDNDDKPKKKPAPKPKPKAKKETDMDVDDEDDKPKAKPKPKPKAKPAAAAKAGPSKDAMDVDGEEKPRPKPKPKAKAKQPPPGDDEQPPKKKLKVKD
ncbi:FACT complex subunit [Pleurotus pulmonarius]|nr:FACT complex subunit [Pleurotus pulmonarius]KAF4591092.1 FACT complex subunit [Pleurotus pulmonarius]